MTIDKQNDSVTDVAEMRRLEFAEEFGLNWEQSGGPRMEGRLIGYLMVTSRPFLSLTDLASALNASAGSVSTTTRRRVSSSGT
jgi:DNA-binding transcriptional regulator GbsR (MarR family)